MASFASSTCHASNPTSLIIGVDMEYKDWNCITEQITDLTVTPITANIRATGTFNFLNAPDSFYEIQQVFIILIFFFASIYAIFKIINK